MLKRGVQSALKKVGVYHRLRNSLAYDLYSRLVDRRVLETRGTEIKFYRTVLKGLYRDALIFDVGANAGQKTDVFVRLGARVVAIEPDPENQKVLREKFLLLRAAPRRVAIVEKALSDKEGVRTMWIEKAGSALNTLNRKWADILREKTDRVGRQLAEDSFTVQRLVETSTLEKMMGTYGHPFYVKVDVEGHELEVIRGLRVAVPYLSIEVNLPEFVDEGMECVRLLGQLSGNGVFNYAADCGKGLVLKEWLPADAFSEVLRRCMEGSIEVFWRTVPEGSGPYGERRRVR